MIYGRYDLLFQDSLIIHKYFVHRFCNEPLEQLQSQLEEVEKQLKVVQKQREEGEQLSHTLFILNKIHYLPHYS